MVLKKAYMKNVCLLFVPWLIRWGWEAEMSVLRPRKKWIGCWQDLPKRQAQHKRTCVFLFFLVLQTGTSRLGGGPWLPLLQTRP